MKIRYSSLDRNFHMSCNVDSIPDQDKVNLLWHLLTVFDPKQGEEYEAYQQAAGVVLREANKFLPKRGT